MLHIGDALRHTEFPPTDLGKRRDALAHAELQIGHRGHPEQRRRHLYPGVPAGVYFRGEVFKDDGGGRTGTDQTLNEVTLTGKYFLSEKLTLWAEFRHDGSDASAFAKDGTITTIDPATGQATTSPRFKDTQNTVSVAASYVF